eukprot:scaffold16696_cov89-Skeletonema_marinoi.AAC.1
MANYNGPLKAVDRHIDCVRYDMVLESRACGRLRCLIKSPRRCIHADMTYKCLSRAKDASILSWQAIMGH